MRTPSIITAAIIVACASEKGIAIHNSEPQVTIYGPDDGSEHIVGESIEFVAQIGDDRDEATRLIRVWQSDVQGSFADTSTVSSDGGVSWSTAQLELGTHSVTLQVIDSEGLTNSASVSVSIVEPEAEEPVPDTDLDGDGFTEEAGDCDDNNFYVNPGATETPYDGIDQDCDGEDLTDVDGDGYDAIVAGGDDCVDTDALSFPGAVESCDSLDNDCDGTVDEEGAAGCTQWYLDEDDDGYGAGVDDSKCLCGPSGDYDANNVEDCDDEDPEVNPDHEGWATFPTESGSWDWNCDGDEEQELEGFGSCSGTLFCTLDSEGWNGATPACGETAMWVTGCSGGSCDVSGDALKQRCR